MREPIEIDVSDIRAQLEALPVCTKGRTIIWTTDDDSNLLEYWPTRGHVEVCRIMGKSRSACEARYRFLRGAQNEAY